MQAFFALLAESFDLPILDWIQANMANPFLDFIMPWITILGDAMVGGNLIVDKGFVVATMPKAST